jgi:TatD DNase family protein
MFVDSHCHLDDKRFADDLDAVLERAAAAGVTRILTIGTGDGPPEIDRAVRLAERYPQVFASVGVHPHDAAKVTAQTYGDLRALAAHSKVVGFGEIGLDYHYDFSPRQTQREVFAEQLGIARNAGLPIIIHTREAWADTMAILREHGNLQGIMHCFTGTPEEAEEALALGLHLAFGGVATFRTAEAVREALRRTPDDRLLIETDAPYLAPIPHRGKRNEPALMMETARVLARVRGVAVEEIGRITTANFRQLCLAPRGFHTNHASGGLPSPKETRYTGGSDGN